MVPTAPAARLATRRALLCTDLCCFGCAPEAHLPTAHAPCEREAHAHAQGFNTIALSTLAETKAAQRFHAKMGYVAVTAVDMPLGYSQGVLDRVFFVKGLA